jgi:phage terminase small subunit
MKTGRKAIPTAALKLHGTFRKDRHADRADATPPNGSPIRPDWFGETESALWDRVVPDLIRRGLVGELDTAQLISMCELWGLYRASYKQAQTSPTDKEIRCAVTGYYAAFDRVASKFGLTSADLAGLKVPKQQTKSTVPARTRA